MIGCLRTRVRKQPIIALYFELENELKFYNLETWIQREKAPCFLTNLNFFFLNKSRNHKWNSYLPMLIDVAKLQEVCGDFIIYAKY